MTAEKWKIYDSFIEFIDDVAVDMDTSIFKVALFQDTSDAAHISGTGLGDLNFQVANVNGTSVR